MKVLAKVNSNTFLAEVSKIELDEFMNIYYKDRKELKVGDEIDLSRGYDFLSDIKKAVTTLTETCSAAGIIGTAINMMIAMSDKLPDRPEVDGE